MYFDLAELTLARIPALEARIEALEAANAALTARVLALEGGDVPPPPPGDYRYVWISPEEIAELPISGPECGQRWAVVVPLGQWGAECPYCGYYDFEYQWGVEND